MERAFNHCTSLETVETAPLDVIYESAFEDCPNLRTVSYMNVSQIPKSAFSGCLMLEEIRISGSQYRTVKENAFYNVSSQLKIYYYGTKAQYEATTVEAGNEAWTNAAVYYINDITSLSLSQTSLTMVLGTASAVKQLLVYTYPEDADVPELIWTNSDPTVATIDYEGVVTARKEGTTIISVATKDGRLRASCTVTVQTIHVTSVRIIAPALKMKTGETIQLRAEVLPENASDKRVMWVTGDPDVATVDENGLVTGVGGGTVEISAVPYDSDSLYDSVMITVEQGVTGVTISKTSTVITLGRSEQLNASVQPASASNQNVTWSSSDPAVASVAKNGLVTALSLGTAVITVRTEDGGYTASCTVTVDPVHPESVTIRTPADWIRYGQFVQMSAAVLPADTTNKNIIWSSSDETIAVVDENGKVTGVGEGIVTITAKAEDNGISAAQRLEVIFIHVQDIYAAEDEIELAAGRWKQLNVTVEPYNASDPKLLFESDDPEVLTVDETGRITGIAEGEAAVTVTSRDGNRTVSIQVTVYPDEIYISGIPETFIYTGAAIRPEPEVYDGRTLLTKGKDYTLAYKNNINTGTATVTIRMTGNYSQSASVTFGILPLAVDDENITVNALTVPETGKPLVFSPVIMFNGKQLKKNVDFTVAYDETKWDGMDAGEHELIIGGTGNFTGYRTMKVFVSPMAPEEAKIPVSKLTVSSLSVNYLDLTGEDFEEEIINHLTVKNGKTLLIYKTDFVVSTFPEDYKKTGKCTFVISGIGRYYGEKTVSVTVKGIALSDKRIKDHENGPYMYTGLPLEMDWSVYYMSWMDGETEVIIGPEDYEVVSGTYKNNVKAGTATVQIRGKNAYTGTRTVKFKITKNTVTTEEDVAVEDPVPYAKGGAKPQVTINDLKPGTDYSLKYTGNTKAGVGKVTVTFKGNCKGTPAIVKEFTITPQDLSVTTMTAKDVLYSTKAGGYRVKPVLKDLNGKTLKLGTDYEKELLYEEVILNGGYYQAVRELGAKDKVKAGTIIAVTAYGNGSYEGQNTAFYRVLPKGTDIAKAAFTIKNQEYTGEPVELDAEAFTKAVVGKTQLVLGEDFEIAGYSGNIEKGTASVTLRGIGNYGGTKTVKFKIVQKKMNEYWAGKKTLQP